jgi:glycosyltransferase involved in cell wall biosynthesis
MVGELKILHICTIDRGGAAQASIRLHRGLLGMGVDSQVLVKRKLKNHPNVFKFYPASSLAKRVLRLGHQVASKTGLTNGPFLSRMERTQDLLKKSLPQEIEYFSFPATGLDITSSPLYKRADIVNLHWVSGFIDYPTFFRKNKKPLVWTIHDMEPFSGGLHYESYKALSQNGKPIKFDLPANLLEVLQANLDIKSRALKNVGSLTVVSPSRWLAEKSVNSSLFGKYTHLNIPYGVDTNTFRPRDKRFSRDFFDLPQDIPIFLFVSDRVETFRKGFSLLSSAIEAIETRDFLLCSVGYSSQDTVHEKVRAMGRIEDERLMSLLYSSADAFIIPSIEDNLPNTVIEALACGTPVIGFSTGGIPDMVENSVNGYLSEDISVSGLGKLLVKFLETKHCFDRTEISRVAAAKYNLSVQAERYANLYHNIYSGVLSN